MISLQNMAVPFWLREPSLGVYIATAVALLVALLLLREVMLRPPFDPREPPLVKPTIPIFGHLFGIMINRVHYFNMVYEADKGPIVTLPMPRNNMYVIFSAHMQQIAMRSNAMEANAATVDLIPRLFGVKMKTLKSWLGKDGVHEDMTPNMMKIFGTTLSGDSLNEMTSTTLVEVGKILNGIGEEGLKIDNLYMWLRYHISHAVSVALFGTKHNPYYNSPEIVDAQWDFEAGLGPLVMGFLPSIVARSAYLARKRVHEVLRPYYENQHDQGPDVSDLVKQRAALFRQWDTNVDQLSKNEISVMLAATTNTIPTMFWYFAHVWTRPSLVAELRAEVSKYIGLPSSSTTTPPDGPTSSVTIHFSKLDASCPLLGSCYREAVRLSSQILTLRKVASDLTISDPSQSGGSGRNYLLKAGNDVMIPAKVVHRKSSTWGADVEDFNPYRFLPDPNGDKEVDRLRKMSFVPFGGGKHYCPGRHFAFAENLAVMAALLLGFELEGLDRDKLRMENSKMGQAAKPEPGWHGGPCVIRRREGWEHVEWRFVK